MLHHESAGQRFGADLFAGKNRLPTDILPTYSQEVKTVFAQISRLAIAMAGARVFHNHNMGAKTLAICVDRTHYLNKFQRLPNERFALLEREPFGFELALDGIYD